jgi:hypothetical protein
MGSGRAAGEQLCALSRPLFETRDVKAALKATAEALDVGRPFPRMAFEGRKPVAQPLAHVGSGLLPDDKLGIPVRPAPAAPLAGGSERLPGVYDRERRDLHYPSGDVLQAVDHTGSGHKWRLINDEP